MIGPETIQAAGEAVKTTSSITGHFVIDGALLIAGFKTVEIIVGKVLPRMNGKTPKPGSADICIRRGEKIVEIETKQKRYDDDVKELKGYIKEIRDAIKK